MYYVALQCSLNQSFCLLVDLLVCLFACLFVVDLLVCYLFVCLLVCYLFVCLFACLLFVCLLVDLLVYYLFVCLLICLFVICLFVCLFACTALTHWVVGVCWRRNSSSFAVPCGWRDSGPYTHGSLRSVSMETLGHSIIVSINTHPIVWSLVNSN